MDDLIETSLLLFRYTQKKLDLLTNNVLKKEIFHFVCKILVKKANMHLLWANIFTLPKMSSMREMNAVIWKWSNSSRTNPSTGSPLWMFSGRWPVYVPYLTENKCNSMEKSNYSRISDSAWIFLEGFIHTLKYPIKDLCFPFC